MVICVKVRLKEKPLRCNFRGFFIPADVEIILQDDASDNMPKVVVFLELIFKWSKHFIHI